MRITKHEIIEIPVRKEIEFTFNNERVKGFDGDTIASALWANNITTIRYSEKDSLPRSMFCGIGNCFECRVYIHKQGMVRACISPIKDNLEVFSIDKEIESNEI